MEKKITKNNKKEDVITTTPVTTQAEAEKNTAMLGGAFAIMFIGSLGVPLFIIMLVLIVLMK